MDARGVKQWFDHLEEIIRREADFAGLYEHGTTIGSAREFFVAKILNAFLPKNIIIGTGQVISALEGRKSKQIDIVIYDGRFPSFSLPNGPALFPVEGVIATIEIKSKLHSKELTDALNNCVSVKDLPLRIQNKSELVKNYMQLNNLDQESAEQQILRMLSPKTYVFAFDGYKNSKTLMQEASQWSSRTGKIGNKYCSPFPDLILTPKLLGISSDTGIVLPEEAVFAVCESAHQLGLLCSHILLQIHHRVTNVSGPTGDLLEYNPLQLYFLELNDGREKQLFIKD